MNTHNEATSSPLGRFSRSDLAILEVESLLLTAFLASIVPRLVLGRTVDAFGVGWCVAMFTLFSWPLQAWSPSGRTRRSKTVWLLEYFVGIVVDMLLYSSQWPHL